MDDKKSGFPNRISRKNTDLLRIGVVFLSIVSFFTTANGMRQYIFTDNTPIAYAASAAIQGILLALSINLPGYLKNICKKPGEKRGDSFDWLRKTGRFFGKSILCIAAVLLTFVTIFCSSWFSYVYIADVIHRDSWGGDSELLVQQAYRTELYSAQDYAHAYRVYLEENVGKRILLLEEYAAGLSDVADLNMNWEKERTDYAPDDGSTGARYMATVIDAMERAMYDGSSQEARELAATAASDAKTNIENRRENIQQNIKELDGNISSYRTQVSNLNIQIARAEAGVDTTATTNSVNTYLRLINDMVQQQVDLQTESRTLEYALDRLSLYESRLGLSSSTSAISIRNSLMQLQSEFFRQEPDVTRMLKLATDIFDSLRNASRTAGDTVEGTGNALTYTNLLLQMNWLTRNLTDYSEIKDIESTIGDLIAKLRTVDFTAGAGPKQPIDSEGEESPSETGAPPELEGEESPAEAGPTDLEGEESPVEAGPTDLGGEESPVEAGPTDPNGETSPTEIDKDADASPNTQNSQWKLEWGERLAALKAQVSALPIYSEEDESGDGMSSILTESQVNILRSYDRSRASGELDDMIRRYISEHNAIYKGILYLQSPYRSLAIFALALALAFDLSGFVFGFVAQGNDEGNGQDKQDNRDRQDTDDEDTAKEDGLNKYGRNPSVTERRSTGKKKQTETNTSDEDMVHQPEWSILKTLKTYIVLTGDYEYRDGNYVYTIFKDGVRYHWPVKDTAPYPQGIYIMETADDDWSRGTSIPASEQNLLFAAQAGGPLDGIYMNCQFFFDEGSLILVHGDLKTFLASIDEYVPVHSYSPSQGKNQTIPVKQLAAEIINVDIAVVALNSKGTRVAAIYILERS